MIADWSSSSAGIQVNAWAQVRAWVRASRAVPRVGPVPCSCAQVTTPIPTPAGLSKSRRQLWWCMACKICSMEISVSVWNFLAPDLISLLVLGDVREAVCPVPLVASQRHPLYTSGLLMATARVNIWTRSKDDFSDIHVRKTHQQGEGTWPFCFYWRAVLLFNEFESWDPGKQARSGRFLSSNQQQDYGGTHRIPVSNSDPLTPRPVPPLPCNVFWNSLWVLLYSAYTEHSDFRTTQWGEILMFWFFFFGPGVCMLGLGYLEKCYCLVWIILVPLGKTALQTRTHTRVYAVTAQHV